jgi:membrane-associated phospholipid phosphatase
MERTAAPHILNETTQEVLTRLKQHLSLPDICTVFMLLLYTVLGVVYFGRVEQATMNIVVNIGLVGALVGLALADAYAPSLPVTIMRKFFLLPGLFFVYGQAHLYIQLVNPYEVDDILIKIDFFLFRVNPTHWLYQFSHPILTEWFQFAYFCYFWIPLTLGFELYRRKDFSAFMDYAYVLCFSFYLSYLLYFIAPAIGPLFTLHRFEDLRAELPGIWFTNFLRDIVNGGSGVHTGSPNPALTAHRNCMPSGHTMITLVNILAAYRFQSRFRGLILVVGVSIIISTVYLRYHYVVDVMAGVLSAFMALFLARRFRHWLAKKGFAQALETASD